MRDFLKGPLLTNGKVRPFPALAEGKKLRKPWKEGYSLRCRGHGPFPVKLILTGVFPTCILRSAPVMGQPVTVEKQQHFTLHGTSAFLTAFH